MIESWWRWGWHFPIILTYILKAKKFAEPPFQSKKFRVIFGPFWVILGPFWAIFGPFRGIFGQICGEFKFFCGPIGVAGLTFRMYVHHPPSSPSRPTSPSSPPCSGVHQRPRPHHCRHRPLSDHTQWGRGHGIIKVMVFLKRLFWTKIKNFHRPTSWDTTSSRDQATSPSKALR